MSLIQFILSSVILTGLLALFLFRKSLFKSRGDRRPAIRPYTFMNPLSFPVRNSYRGIIEMSVLQPWEFNLLRQTSPALVGKNNVSTLGLRELSPDSAPVAGTPEDLSLVDTNTAMLSTEPPDSSMYSNLGNADLDDVDMSYGFYENYYTPRQEPMLKETIFSGKTDTGASDVDRLGALIRPADSDIALYQIQEKEVSSAMRAITGMNVSEVDAYVEKAREYQRESDLINHGAELSFKDAMEQVFEDHAPSPQTRAGIDFMLNEPVRNMATESVEVLVESYDLA